MIHIETKNGKISCRMVGQTDDLIAELLYGVTQFHIKAIQELREADPAIKKEKVIRAVVEAFCDVLTVSMEAAYGKAFPPGQKLRCVTGRRRL